MRRLSVLTVAFAAAEIPDGGVWSGQHAMNQGSRKRVTKNIQLHFKEHLILRKTLSQSFPYLLNVDWQSVQIR